MPILNENKLRLETLILKSGIGIGAICKAAKTPPRVFYELRRRKYLKPPTTVAVGRLAKVLGVTRLELLRMICANSPASKVLVAQVAAKDAPPPEDW